MDILLTDNNRIERIKEMNTILLVDLKPEMRTNIQCTILCDLIGSPDAEQVFLVDWGQGAITLKTSLCDLIGFCVHLCIL